MPGAASLSSSATAGTASCATAATAGTRARRSLPCLRRCAGVDAPRRTLRPAQNRAALNRLQQLAGHRDDVVVYYVAHSPRRTLGASRRSHPTESGTARALPLRHLLRDCLRSVLPRPAEPLNRSSALSLSPNRADSAPYASSVVNGHDALHLIALDEAPQAFARGAGRPRRRAALGRCRSRRAPAAR